MKCKYLTNARILLSMSEDNKQYICPASSQIAPRVCSFISFVNYSSLHETD